MIKATIIATTIPAPKTAPNPLAEGRGSSTQIFVSLALVVLFFWMDNMVLSSLILLFSFSVSFALIGTDPTTEQGQKHPEKGN